MKHGWNSKHARNGLSSTYIEILKSCNRRFVRQDAAYCACTFMIKTKLAAVLIVLSNFMYAQTGDSLQKKLARFDAELTGKISPKEPGLSIIITRGNQVVFEKYYGYANLEQNIKLNAEHVLGIASMSKQFTGMAAVILVEEGKLSLEDDIKKYMPNLPIGDRKITISQLLSHTSGLPEITKNEEFMNHIAQRHSVQEIIDMAFKGDFTAEPGVKYQYCNTGYIIMAALIEKLSGQSYAAFLRNRIFLPLEMNDTYACDYYRNADNAVPRYFADSTGYAGATTMHFSNLIGGGNIITNAGDMAKWGMALISGDKLPRNYKKIWQSNRLNSGEETGYGLGLAGNEYNGKPYFYHPGMGDGMNSVNFIFPEDGITVTVIRNQSKPKLTSVETAQLATDYLFFKKY